MELMKQAEYARRCGVRKQALIGWKKHGWLVFKGDLIDVAASDANVKMYRREGLTVLDAKLTEAVKQGESAAQAAERILIATGAPLSIEEAKRVKENYLAKLHQLEYDQKSGAVVLVTDVTKAVGEEYAKVRSRLLSIPSEMAPRLARLKTAVEMQDSLRAGITEALEELTMA